MDRHDRSLSDRVRSVCNLVTYDSIRPHLEACCICSRTAEKRSSRQFMDRSPTAPNFCLCCTIQSGKGSVSWPSRGSLVHSHGINDLHGVAELEAVGSAMIEAHECGHDLGDWR